MKRRDFIKLTSATGVAILITPGGIFHAYGQDITTSFIDGFLSPPDSSRTHTFWFWMNGNITKTGITSDLEAIKEAGVGGVLNFDAGTGMVKGPVEYGSPEYWDLKNHAISECNRLGLFFGMHNCPGWSSSGGPWVAPENSMMEVSWSETVVQGAGELNVKLPRPFSRMDFYQDTYVLAYPALKGELALTGLVKNVSSNNNAIDVDQLTDSPEGVIILPSTSGEDAWLQFEFKESFQTSYLSFISKQVGNMETVVSPPSTGAVFNPGMMSLEVSDDGIHFEKVMDLNLNLQNGGSFGVDLFYAIDFPEVTARFIRIRSSSSRQFSMIRFSAAGRIADWKSKANYTSVGDERLSPTEVELDAVINPNEIIDLTGQMDADGELIWDAPDGDWMILRLGYTTKGTLNRAAPEGGEGLEIDKYSKIAMDKHFESMMSELLPTMAPLAEKGKAYLEIDSWEVGLQNWTPKFPEEFRQRAGYELTSFLPAMTGRIVGSAETSDRFLWDLRRVQADLIADNYYGHFNKICKRYGFLSYNEPYENGPFEELQISSRVDVSMGEFWSGLSTWFPWNYEHRRSVKLCASVAHVFGRKIVGAEAFTAEAPSGKWQEYPFALKALGDKYFTEGLTRVVFHRYAMQPHPDSNVAPGMTMSYWGMHFERTNTWWKQGRKWLDYLARCQYMLQQGLFVADLVYFTGEGAPKHTKIFREELHPEPPLGYDYDVIDREVILDRMEIRNGRIVLPGGMGYRILVVQDYETMSLELVQNLHKLVWEGMILVGEKPKRAPGLGIRSGNDEEMLMLANELWGDINGKTVKEHQFGKGRVFWGDSMQDILNKVELDRDFDFSSRSGDAPIRYIHRQFDNTEVYFVCNERRTYEDLVCTFRIAGKQPEFWDADTGEMIQVGVYETDNGLTRVPVQLKPYGSLFVVFRAPASEKQLRKVLWNNQTVIDTTSFAEVPQIRYDHVINDFTICVWVKPEIDIMLEESKWGIYRQWTDYYAIYPPSGNELYGPGHETCGLAVGRNGVAIWHRQKRWPCLMMVAPAKIEGWSHVALVYRNGVPSVYLNGKKIEGLQKSKEARQPIVHPGLGKAFLYDGASYYNGDLGKPQLFDEVLSEERLLFLVNEKKGERLNENPFVVAACGKEKPALLFNQNGNYHLYDNTGKGTEVTISSVSSLLSLSGEWEVHFPPHSGAPEKIKLPELISLHKHELDGVKYFSGTAVYKTKFELKADAFQENKRLFLDLGKVEIAAEIEINKIKLGTLWTRPYQVDISDAAKEGENELLVKVVNLWPNRLIGDEQLPPEYEFEQPQADRGACIREMPDWYLNGQPKPKGERISFSTWQHYKKDDPLLESGLIGPVVIRNSVIQKI